MAQDSDSDSSSSIPFGPPGGGPLTFLPIQPSQNNQMQTQNDGNISSHVDNMDDDDDDDNKEDESSSSSDSDSTPMGIPGGASTLSFVPMHDADTKQDSDSSSSSSSSSSSPMGVPGGGVQLTFVPTNTLQTDDQKHEDGDNDDGDDHNNDDDESTSDSDEESMELPGGGSNLTFLPTNTNIRNRISQIHEMDDNMKIINNNNNDRHHQNGNHMTVLSYDEDPDDDDINFEQQITSTKKRSVRSLHVSSKSNDEVCFNNIPDDEDDDYRITPSKPRISTAKTITQHKKAPTIHRKIRSSTLAETRRQHTAIWDLVYMTSSPLVCRSNFDAKQSKKNDKLIPLELLDVSRETEEFMNVLSTADRQLCVVHEIATSGNLIKAMTHECRILHYSGHGFPSYLAFEDENSIGDTHMLQDIAFKKIVSKGHKLQLKFVFTSACHSESVGEAFVSAGVPHVVSIDTKFEVSDEGAMTFTKYFYEALLCGRTIRDSFKLAKQSVQFISSSAKRDFEKFKLLPKNGKHDVSLFKNLNAGKLINKSSKIPPNNLPTTIVPFIGRSIDMRDIIHSFMAKKNESCRILNIYGDKGVGKSSIAIMLARYLNDRKIYFKNGIYYINILKLIMSENATSLTEMIQIVINKAFDEYNNRLNNNKYSDAPHTIMKYDENLSLISNLKLFCRYGLFIIDDIDQLILYYKTNDIDIGRELFNVIFKILIEVSEKIKFIIISKKIINEIYKYNNNSQLSPKTYQLKRLSSTDCSNLFSKLTAGQWRPNDIKENIDIMSILKNNPLQIHELAKLKNQWECQTLTKLVETYNFKNKLERKQGLNNNHIIKQTQRKQNRQQLIKQYIKNPAAQQVWRKAHGMELCDYYKIFEILKYDFTEYTFSKRKLQQNNLMECFQILGMNQDLTINIEKFDTLYNWFNGLTRLVTILSDYYNKTNPIIIHGFVSRDDAQNMLLQNKHIPIGTFIIRFRYKQAKSIAISYKLSVNNISNLKCDLSNNNDSTFICGKKLLPFNEFILSYPRLKFLYHPKTPIPKEQIFNSDNNNNDDDDIDDNNRNHHNNGGDTKKKGLKIEPSWKNVKSWNPPQHQSQPPMIHAPTQNPYVPHHHHQYQYQHQAHQPHQRQQYNMYHQQQQQQQQPPSHHHYHHHQQHQQQQQQQQQHQPHPQYQNDNNPGWSSSKSYHY